MLVLHLKKSVLLDNNFGKNKLSNLIFVNVLAKKKPIKTNKKELDFVINKNFNNESLKVLLQLYILLSIKKKQQLISKALTFKI